MGQTVMMVDDDETFLEELGEVLSSSGYQPVAVPDPRKVVETAKKIRPALILMDLKMPWKSGFELAFELKNKAELADIPVIAMSGNFRSQKIPLLELSGIRKCLTKPLTPRDVIGAIEATLVEDRAGVSGSLNHIAMEEQANEKKFLLGRFDDLLLEMAGDADLSTLSDMSEKLAQLKHYKIRMSQSLSRPQLKTSSKNVASSSYA